MSIIFLIDTRKHSAKGITKVTQRLLTHEKYIETLASGNLVRAENTRIISERHILNTVRANKIALSAYDDKRYILSNGISTLPYGHYRTVNASIFPDSNQDDDDDDSERNMSETNSTSQHKDQDLDDWLKFFEEEEELVDWDQQSSNQEEIFTQDTNYGSEDSFLVLDTQPSQSLRDLLNSITSYEDPDPGRIRVTEIAESDIESDDLVDPNAVTSSSSSDDEWYFDREAVEDSAPQSKRRKTNKKL